MCYSSKSHIGEVKGSTNFQLEPTATLHQGSRQFETRLVEVKVAEVTRVKRPGVYRYPVRRVTVSAEKCEEEEAEMYRFTGIITLL